MQVDSKYVLRGSWAWCFPQAILLDSGFAHLLQWFGMIFDNLLLISTDTSSLGTFCLDFPYAAPLKYISINYNFSFGEWLEF